MKFLLIAIPMAFAGYLAAQTSNTDEANGVSDQALDMTSSDASYMNGQAEVLPPIIREHPYRVVRRVPVIQKVIDVVRPVIETVKVPVTVRERRFAPAVMGRPAPPPQGGGQGGPDQGPPGAGGDQGGQPQFQGQGFGGGQGGGQHPQFQQGGGQMGQQMGQQQGQMGQQQGQ